MSDAIRHATNEYDLAKSAMEIVTSRTTELEKIYDTVTEINLWCRGITDRQKQLEAMIKAYNDTVTVAFSKMSVQQDAIVKAGNEIANELKRVNKLFGDIATLP